MGDRELAEISDRMSASLSLSRKEILDYVKNHASSVRASLDNQGQASIPTRAGRFILKKERLRSSKHAG